MWLKLVYTAFMIVWVPSYWRAYGPSNFLYFCDIALFVTLLAIWAESPLLASAPAVGILIPQCLWCVDYVCGLFGYFPLGMTVYMFEHDDLQQWYNDGLSFFHLWLPLLLLYLVAKLGYHRRAIVLWTVFTWVLLTVCYLWMPAPPAPEYPEGARQVPVNINYVYGLHNDAAQTRLSPNLWFTLLMAGMPVLIYLPTHWMLDKWRGKTS
jgi:hypothetical protein